MPTRKENRRIVDTMKQNSKLILLLIVIFAMVIVVLSLREFILVDKCLDAGGKFNYENSECILSG